MKKRYTRKLRSTPAGKGRVRVDLTIPAAVLAEARMEVGDVVEMHVTPSRKIALVALRSRWPATCRSTATECLLAEGHDGPCVPDEEVPE